MIDHIGVRTAKSAEAKRFNDAAFAAMGGGTMAGRASGRTTIRITVALSFWTPMATISGPSAMTRPEDGLIFRRAPCKPAMDLQGWAG